MEESIKQKIQQILIEFQNSVGEFWEDPIRIHIDIKSKIRKNENILDLNNIIIMYDIVLYFQNNRIKIYKNYGEESEKIQTIK